LGSRSQNACDISFSLRRTSPVGICGGSAFLASLIAQASRLTLTSRAFRNDQLAPFYEELCALTRLHKALPMNSGAEAVKSALKVVRSGDTK
jgi:acetylornithine/succinyldiaminopimelate/putrescine aminotransferase